MYISNKVLKKIGVISIIQMLFGAANSFFWGIMILYGIFADEEFWEDIEIYIIFAILFAIFVFILFCGIKNAKLKGIARRYNSVFMADENGYLVLSELAIKIGTSEKKVVKEIEKLLRKGCLVNCTLLYGNTPYVVLNGEDKPITEDLISIICKTCGASIVVRKNFLSTCKYCGAEIRL